MGSDSSLEKWIYKEHTRVKHDILKKYLPSWLRVLGTSHSRLCYFDGFAGRGEYEDGSPGSPLIAMEIAEDLVSRGKVKEVVPIFIEKDPDNFANLERIIKASKSRFPNVRDPILRHNEFRNAISEVIESVGLRLAPSFFFIDPFGFTGVPFATVKDILSIPRTEIFFTFMA
jgi:three-Cys-motif partner protein